MQHLGRRLMLVCVQGRKAWRMGEPLLIIAIFVSLSMLLPLAFPCTPTNCYIKQGDSKPYCPEGTSSNIRSAQTPCLSITSPCWMVLLPAKFCLLMINQPPGITWFTRIQSSRVSIFKFPAMHLSLAARGCDCPCINHRTDTIQYHVAT